MLRTSLMFVLIGCSSAFASTADTQELLEAPRVTQYVSIALREGANPSLRYSLDSVGESKLQHDLRDETPLAAFHKVNVVLEFVNPVTHTWSTTEKVEDDPSFVAMKQFATAANGFVTVLGGGSATSAGASALGARLMGVAPGASGLQVFAPDLVELAMWLQQQPYRTCMLTPKYVDALNESDADFYVTSSTTRAASLWRGKSLGALRAVVEASSFSDFTAAQKALKAAIPDLTNGNNEARERLKMVELGAGQFIDSTGNCAAFAIYAKVAIAKYVATAAKLVAARDEMVKDLTLIHDQSDKILGTVGTDGGKTYFVVAGVESESAKLKRLTFSLKRRAVSLPSETELGGRVIITEKESLSAVLKFRRYQYFVFEAAPGFAWVFGQQRPYGTATVEGTTVVTGGAAEPLGVLAVGMLNIIPRPLGGSFLWLVGQIGIGTGKPLLMLLAGGGLRFSSIDLSLTAGAAMTLQRVPNTLHVGDPVADAATLDKDMRLEAVASPYVGFQKSF